MNIVCALFMYIISSLLTESTQLSRPSHESDEPEESDEAEDDGNLCVVAACAVLPPLGHLEHLLAWLDLGWLVLGVQSATAHPGPGG